MKGLYLGRSYWLMWAGMGENKANMFTGLRGLDGPSVPREPPWLAADCGYLAMDNPTCTPNASNQEAGRS